MRPLSVFARCARGIATGANDFFTLSDDEVRRWGLPAAVLRPCVTKAAHVAGAQFTADDFAALRAAGRKAWLFDVTGENAEYDVPNLDPGLPGDELGVEPPSSFRAPARTSGQKGQRPLSSNNTRRQPLLDDTPSLFEHPSSADGCAKQVEADESAIRIPQSAMAYLAHGESLGIHQRYLTRHRTPWYAAERRPPADIWAAVFGRGRLRFVHNAASVLSLTTFHAVYLRPEYRRFLPLLMVYFHSSLFDRLRAAEQRVYGDGLLKLEPRDVERLLAPDLDHVSNALLAASEELWPQLASSRSNDSDLRRRIDGLFPS